MAGKKPALRKSTSQKGFAIAIVCLIRGEESMTANGTESLRQRQTELAEKIVELQYQRQSQVWKPYGDPGRAKSVRDTAYHLTYLVEAVEAGEPLLFSEYLAWVKSLFAGLNFPEDVLPTTLACMRQVLVAELPAEESAPLLAILDASAGEMAQASVEIPSFLTGDAPLDALARRFLDSLLNSNRRAASEMILEAVQGGVTIPEIYLQVFQRTQWEIGRLWQTSQIGVAQEHFCTAATQLVMSQLYPYIFTGERKDRRIVIACVGGELHEIGARMVADLFEMRGWDTYFLGANSPPSSIVRTVEERRADILGISVTMTFHVSKVTEMIRTIRATSSVSTRILVGGYPFNLSPDLWQKTGADGYAPDAEAAILEAEKVLSK